MSEINLENKVEQIDVSPAVYFSKVILNTYLTTENSMVQFISGDDTGAVLDLTLPFGSQDMADSILSQLSTVEYNPYIAENAVLDPAVELGDTVIVANVISGIYRQKLEFDHFMWQTLEAPYQSETEGEYKVERKENREFNRQIANMGSKITQNASAITAEVTAREKADSALSTSIELTAGRVAFTFLNESEVGQLTNYIDFVDGNIIISSTESNFKLIIKRDRISFMDGEAEVAYVSNNQFLTPYQVVQSTLDLGGYQFDTTDGIAINWKGR